MKSIALRCLCLVTILALFEATFLGTASHAAVVKKLVALTGTRPLGSPQGTVFNDFYSDNPIVINNAGRVAFPARLDGLGLNDRTAYGTWTGTPGSIVPVVLGGSLAPGTTGGTQFSTPTNVIINNAGQISLRSYLYGDNVHGNLDDTGIWSGISGALQLVARPSYPAPGAGGAIFSPGSTVVPAFNDLGQTAFLGFLSGPGTNDTNNIAYWVGTPGGLSIAARFGMQAPGLPDGVKFGAFPASDSPPVTRPSLSASGIIAFNSNVVGPGITLKNEHGIWTGKPGDLVLAAREGDPAVGALSGETFGVLKYPANVNSFGQIAFVGALAGATVTNSNDTAIWVGSPGTLQLAARNGSHAPGTPAGTVFNHFPSLNVIDSPPALNDKGEIAFTAHLSGPGVNPTNMAGIWSGTATDLSLIARQGQATPEGAPGVFFTGLGGDSLSINNLGHIAFLGSTGGTATYQGIWAGDPDALHLVIKTGDQLDIGGGILRTVSQLSLRGEMLEGYGSTWNDFDQLVFGVGFTDGSKALVMATVPEPSTLALAALGALGLLIAARRNR